MQEIINLIVNYATAWGPAVIAVAGIVITTVKCVATVKSEVDKLKEDTDLRDVKQTTAEIAAENQELIRCNKLLLDEITRVNGYADAKSKETK